MAAQTEQQRQKDGHLDLAQERVHLASERTDWALQRTLLAGERTFSAWVRTGVAATAAGLGIAKLLGSIGPPWMTRTVGAILILAGAASYSIAMWRYSQSYHNLKLEGMKVTPLWTLGLVILALLASAALAFVLLWHPGPVISG